MFCYLDTETHPFGPGDMAPRVVCVSVAFADEPPALFLPEDVPWARVFSGYIVGANLAYDMSCIGRMFPHLWPAIIQAYREGRVLDIQLAQGLIDNAAGVLQQPKRGKAHPYSLAALVLRYLGVVAEKDAWRTHYAKLDGIPLRFWPAGAVDYALDDVALAREVWKHLRDSDKLGLLGHAGRGAWALHECHVDGVYADGERVDRLVDALDAKINVWRRRMLRSGLLRPDKVLRGGRVKPGTKDRGKAVAWAQRLNGTDSLTKDSTAQGKSYLLRLWTAYDGADRLRTRVVQLHRGSGKHPLHPEYDSMKETYRTSSRTGDHGIQIQNMPRGLDKKLYGEVGDLRGCLTPGEGNVFFQCDYNQAELHSLEQLCKVLFGFSRMGDLLAQGVDVHVYVASRLIGCSVEQFLQLLADEQKRLRTLGKVANFGLPGMLGAAKLQVYAWTNYGVRLTLEEAKALKATWLAAFPEMGLYLRWVSDQCARSPDRIWSEEYQKFFGVFDLVHPITGFQRGRVGGPDGANTGFQHLTAYYAKDALFEAQAAKHTPGSPLFGTKIWGFIHDEIVGTCARAKGSACALELSRIMVDAVKRTLPESCITAPPCWAEVYNKSMESKIVDGKVSEWRPS